MALLRKTRCVLNRVPILVHRTIVIMNPGKHYVRFLRVLLFLFPGFQDLDDFRSKW